MNSFCIKLIYVLIIAHLNFFCSSHISELVDKCIGSRIHIIMKNDTEIVCVLLGFDDYASILSLKKMSVFFLSYVMYVHSFYSTLQMNCSYLLQIYKRHTGSIFCLLASFTQTDFVLPLIWNNVKTLNFLCIFYFDISPRPYFKRSRKITALWFVICLIYKGGGGVAISPWHEWIIVYTVMLIYMYYRVI